MYPGVEDKELSISTQTEAAAVCVDQIVGVISQSQHRAEPSLFRRWYRSKEIPVCARDDDRGSKILLHPTCLWGHMMGLLAVVALHEPRGWSFSGVVEFSQVDFIV